MQHYSQPTAKHRQTKHKNNQANGGFLPVSRLPPSSMASISVRFPNSGGISPARRIEETYVVYLLRIRAACIIDHLDRFYQLPFTAGWLIYYSSHVAIIRAPEKEDTKSLQGRVVLEETCTICSSRRKRLPMAPASHVWRSNHDDNNIKQ